MATYKTNTLSVKANGKPWCGLMASFMSLENQIFLTKKIYSLHKEFALSNLSILKKTYLYFRAVVPDTMKEWVSGQNTGALVSGVNAVDKIHYLNTLFVKENEALYRPLSPNQNNMPVVDNNVYKQCATIRTREGLKTVPYEYMGVEDMKNLDVWSKTTVDTNSSKYRYNNTIPIWQKSMNTRHYDRSNEGFHHSNSTRASLGAPIYGYNMSAIYDIYKR